MHLYDDDLPVARRILAAQRSTDGGEMEQLEAVDACATFVQVERDIRVNGRSDELDTLPRYWRSLAGVFEEFARRRDGHRDERALANVASR